MSERRDAYGELVSADPVDRAGLGSHASPAAQRLLRSILATPRKEPPPTEQRFRWRRLAMVVAIAVAALASLAAVWILTRPVTQPQAIACFQAPHLTASRVGVQSGPTASAAACEEVWADGTLSNPDYGPPGTVPPLVACVGDAGSLFVFPSDDPAICSRLGLTIPDPDSIPDAERVRALNDALVGYFSARPCIPIPQALSDVRQILDEHRATDWSIVETEGTDDRPCASFGLDTEEQTIYLVPIPDRTP